VLLIFQFSETTPNPEYQSRSFFHDDVSIEGRSMSDTIVCPEKFTCTRLFGQTEHVCCSNEEEVKVDSEVSAAETEETAERQQSSE
jgi:hypothetical protein